MAGDGQVHSIRDRINAFNIAGTSDHLGRAPITANQPDGKIPTRPSNQTRSQSTNVIPVTVSINGKAPGIANEPTGLARDGILPPPTNIIRSGPAVPPPASTTRPEPRPRLPPREESLQTPSLPPRQRSIEISRKKSDDSAESTTLSSTLSSDRSSRQDIHGRTPSMDGSRIKAPVFDPASLPPLPPKRPKEQMNGHHVGGGKARQVSQHKSGEAAPIRPARPDPSLRQSDPQSESLSLEAVPTLPPRSKTSVDSPGLLARKLPPVDIPPVKPVRSALVFGMNQTSSTCQDGIDTSPIHDLKPQTTNGVPPVIPMSSRPDLSKLLATKPKPQAIGTTSIKPSKAVSVFDCLVCRNFKAVDAHAAKFQRQNVPSLDWLAVNLTEPFPSLTDKARAIFTWLHHNVAYDVVAFFNHNVQRCTPASTLQSGLAVCEGYATLFSALATKAGLECIVISGHGKGFGFASQTPGAPLPPENPTGHAWNAVKIDHGRWKLVDPCWGAGHISGAGQPYTAKFSPRMFCMTNAEFGLRHFPSNRAHFFLDHDPPYSQNIPIPSWREYILGPLGGAQCLQVYSGVAESEGISETAFIPATKQVRLQDSPIVRFLFSRVCEHWDPFRNGEGKPYVFVLQINTDKTGTAGKSYIPFDTNGSAWWLDIESHRLGRPGETVSAYTVNTINGQSGRGLTIDEYKNPRGGRSTGFGGLAMWELA